MDYRMERDSMGEMEVPADRYWGAQTQRSYQNFQIGTEKMPEEIVRAFGRRRWPTTGWGSWTMKGWA